MPNLKSTCSNCVTKSNSKLIMTHYNLTTIIILVSIYHISWCQLVTSAVTANEKLVTDQYNEPTSDNIDLATINKPINNNVPRRQFINGNHAIYVEPPANFKPIIYESSKVVPSQSAPSSLQQNENDHLPPAGNQLEFESNQASAMNHLQSNLLDPLLISSSGYELSRPLDLAGIDESVPRFKPAIGRWSDWRDMSLEPELAASESDIGESSVAIHAPIRKRYSVDQQQSVSPIQLWRKGQAKVRVRFHAPIKSKTSPVKSQPNNKSQSIQAPQTSSSTTTTTTALQMSKTNSNSNINKPRFFIKKLKSTKSSSSSSLNGNSNNTGKKSAAVKSQLRSVRVSSARPKRVTNSRRRKIKTLVPVGLSSWLLGGMRDLDGKHWKLPAEVIDRLKVNDIDLVNGVSYKGTRVGNSHEQANNADALDLSQESKEPLIRQQQSNMGKPTSADNKIPRRR